MHSLDKSKRPLSPHLQVYQPQLTSILSILHRMTGIALSVGAFAFVLWLHCIAKGEPGQALIETISSHFLFKIILFFWTFSLFFHLLNGIRHLYWDMGKGFELKSVYLSGYVVVILSIVFSILFYGEVLWRS